MPCREIPQESAGDVGSQQEEGDRHYVQGAALGGALLGNSGGGASLAQPPQQPNSADDLDAGVHAEADQGDAAGEQPSADGHERLDDIPPDGEILQPQPAAV
jgi:hypothetical protein